MSDHCTIPLPALEALIDEQLERCTPAQRETYRKLRVPIRPAPISRHGNIESVFIVAQRASEVMYYEDVEKGFNFSFIDARGTILHHWGNRDDLSQALPHWMGFAKRSHRHPTVPASDRPTA
ncbi:MAG: hypothetical protein O3C57_05230 [Verrucomicrobia bacterium]|nr:hypothetical protein [Verrucomicrobiota bacterium]